MKTTKECERCGCTRYTKRKGEMFCKRCRKFACKEHQFIEYLLTKTEKPSPRKKK